MQVHRCQSFTTAPSVITEKVHLRRSRSNKFNDPVTFLPALSIPGGSQTTDEVALRGKVVQKKTKITIQQDVQKSPVSALGA